MPQMAMSHTTDPKKELLGKVGNVEGIDVFNNAVLVAIYVRPTKTKSGIKIRAKLDTRTYETGVEVSDEELEDLQLFHDKFHGEWNYAVTPQT